jgi:TRAP-type mannitol/chloroaromatic compound transport system permease small subunit
MSVQQTVTGGVATKERTGRVDAIIRPIEKLSEVSGRTFSWLILVMVGGIVFEVIARYIFSNPTDWAYEFTTMIYGGYCILLGAYTDVHDKHIRMDAVYGSLKKRTQSRFNFFTGWFSIAYLVFFVIISGKFAWSSLVDGEVSTNSTWEAPMYPFKIAICLGAVLLLLQQIVWAIRYYRESFGEEGK